MIGCSILLAVATLAAGPAPVRVPFTADDGVHGDELWVTDGTAGGTKLLKDIRPGKEQSRIIPRFAVVDGTYYFGADDGRHGRELWRTDLTPSGTVLVKDLRPGPKASDPQWFSVWNGAVVFTATSDGGGPDLYRTDGTANGTKLLDRAEGGEYKICGMGVLGNALVYVRDGEDRAWATEICRMDGGQTSKPQCSAQKGSWKGVVWNCVTWPGPNTMYFSGSESDLWKTNGTAQGTSMVQSFDAGDFRSGTVFQNVLLFHLVAGGDTLWKSDGTAKGTQSLLHMTDIDPTDVAAPVVHKNLVYFPGYSPDADQRQQLWKTDGTKQGTALVKDLYPGAARVELDYLFLAGDTIMILAREGENGVDLWRSDGTAAGTTLVKQIGPRKKAGKK